jgi:release factor glutamine methyltransferase
MNYSDLFFRSMALLDSTNKGLDIQLLMEAAFGLSRTEFWIKKNEEITDHKALRKFYRYRTRRLKKEPIAYIIKKRDFYGLTFYVDKNVLIPRPETEILVEKAAGLLTAPSEILDIGAGSGIISITLAKETGSTVTAVENCKKALKVLKRNITLHNVKDRVVPLCADLFPSPGRRFDMIVSNPPYIPESEWRELEPGVRDFEPKVALAAGDDGLDVIRRIIEHAGDYLKPGGILLMEIGYNQRDRVKVLLEEAGFCSVEFVNDFSQIPRVAVGKHAARAPY